MPRLVADEHHRRAEVRLEQQQRGRAPITSSGFSKPLQARRELVCPAHGVAREIEQQTQTRAGSDACNVDGPDEQPAAAAVHRVAKPRHQHDDEQPERQRRAAASLRRYHSSVGMQASRRPCRAADARARQMPHAGRTAARRSCRSAIEIDAEPTMIAPSSSERDERRSEHGIERERALRQCAAPRSCRQLLRRAREQVAALLVVAKHVWLAHAGDSSTVSPLRASAASRATASSMLAARSDRSRAPRAPARSRRGLRRSAPRHAACRARRPRAAPDLGLCPSRRRSARAGPANPSSAASVAPTFVPFESSM